MAFETGHQYPPAAFCSKYEKFLAPHGILLPPKQVLKNRKLGEDADKTLRKAFKITLNKLRKTREACAECGQKTGSPVVCGGCQVARYCSDVCRQPRRLRHSLVCDDLRHEHLDQVVECLPSPLLMGKEVLQGCGGPVSSWKDWLEGHTSLRSSIASAVTVVSLWWQYTELKSPGEAALQLALERMVSNVFSTVLTISHSVVWSKQPALFHASTSGQDPASRTLTADDTSYKTKDVHIHLLGADKPEVSVVESGLVQICSRVLRARHVKLTMVAPDLARHPQTLALSPTNPLKVGSDVSVGCYHGLYHNFWAEHVDTDDQKKKVPRPDVAVAIHPGCHTPEMWVLWRPTFQLLAKNKVPLLLTTYNAAEHAQTLRVLQELRPSIAAEGRNPLGSLLSKQTPYEPDHVWSPNAYAILIYND